MFGFEYYTSWIIFFSLLLFLYGFWNYITYIGRSAQTLYATHRLIVQTSGNGVIGHGWNFFKRYVWYRWTLIRDSVMGNVTIRPDGTTEVTYVAYGKVYTYIVKPRRGPSSIIAAFDETDDLKTEYVVSLLGPNRDWHGREYTAKDLGCKSLTLELTSGDSSTFNGSEVIRIE